MSSRSSSLYLRAAWALVLTASCGESSAPPPSPSQPANPIMVGMHLHIDPVGIGSPVVPNPTREQRVAEYETHREAMQWLTRLCQEKGCRISAQMTGVYAEFVTKLGHASEFADFMPEGPHRLGVHLHYQYKDPSTDTEDFAWSDAPLGTSAVATQVWNDEIPVVNTVFEQLGFPATANDQWDGAQSMCEDMMVCLGHRAGAAYPNKFTIVGGSRDHYHPHRWNPESPQMTKESLKNGPAVAVPLGIEGVFGVNGLHGPDGWINGSLEFAQRDYVLEYAEWRYSSAWDTTRRPWVFEVSFHPYNIVANVTDPSGRIVRDTLATLYDWLRQGFSDTFVYANRSEVVAAYETWQAQHPDDLIFVDADPSTPEVEPQMYTSEMKATLVSNRMYLSRSDRSSNPELFEFTNDKGQKAILAIAEAVDTRLDVSRYLSGSVSEIRMGGQPTALGGAPVSVLLPAAPVLFTEVTAVAPSCGDGTCDDIERTSGMCAADCSK